MVKPDNWEVLKIEERCILSMGKESLRPIHNVADISPGAYYITIVANKGGERYAGFGIVNILENYDLQFMTVRALSEPFTVPTPEKIKELTDLLFEPLQKEIIPKLQDALYAHNLRFKSAKPKQN